MGATPTTCCSSGDGNESAACCPKGGGNANEIVRPRPVDFPGLGATDDLEEKGGAAGAAVITPGDVAGGGQGDAGKNKDLDTSGDKEETYDDGSKYSGQLVDGRRHGVGTWTSVTEQYAGQWRNDQRDGQGRQTWQDGRLYEGQFHDGKFDGHGRMEWHTPHGLMVYEGQYANDVKHGSGKYAWPDGRSYEGQWARSKRWGRATYTNSAGEKREGIWKEDKIEKWLDDENAGGAAAATPEAPPP